MRHSIRRHAGVRVGLTALTAAAALALGGMTAASASAQSHSAAGKPAADPHAHLHALPGHHDYGSACAITTGHRFYCLALVRTNVQPHVQPAIHPDAGPVGDGYGPSDLQSAYKLPSSTAGSGETVAVVDAFNDPDVTSDLATYRSAWGLPACGTGCFSVVNQNGGASPLPPNSPPGDDWSLEESLDLDMVSAICPLCHIIVVEADDDTGFGLFAAQNTAADLGAEFISNSWGGAEDTSDPTDDSLYFNHPGVAITASAGDDGFGVSYPSTSPDVTSVGGTTLTKTSNARGWTESVWGSTFGGTDSGTGSGCSTIEPKPSWQTDTGCAKRTDTDVSAVADPNTGVAVYDTDNGDGGWNEVGGTSASSPIIASVYALAGTPAAGTNPASYIYKHTSDLYDVTSGANGTCSPAYLCTGEIGYDGPTGWGTPDGTAAFSSGSTTNTVTVTNPGNQTGTTGSAASLQIQATDSASGQTLTYTATGLPPGLSINSSTGLISGTPTSAGSYNVTVTATDTTGASGSATFTWTINNVVSVTNPGAQSGTTGTAASLQIHASDSASGQTLTYTASGLPTGLSINSSTGLISGTPTSAGSYNVTVTATDGTGASGSATFSWTISNVVSVTNPGAQSGTTGTAASLQIHASDSASGQTLTYTSSGLPTGLSINSSTGLISGTPTSAGSYNVTVTATDGTGAHGSTTFTWTINNVVSVTNPGNQTGTTGSAASLQIQASDSDSGQTLTYTATGLPTGLSINASTGLISGTPTTAGVYNVTVTATDGTGAHGSASFTWSITNVVTVTNPGAQSGTTGTAASLQIQASDSDSGQTLTYTATGLPTGLSINASTGLISGTPTSAGSYNVTVTVTDGTGASGSASFIWSITNVVTVTNPGAQSGTTGTAASLQVQASDSGSGQTLIYTASGLPAGLSINAATGLISGTPTSAGTYNVTVTAADGTGASGSASFVWSITNVVTVTNPGSQTGTVGSAVSLQVQASDSGSGQTLIYTASGLPVGLSINPATGLISGTPSAEGVYHVTVGAADGTGASGSATFTWTIADPTQTSVTCSPNPVQTGQSSTCTATVSDTAGGATPTGVVGFGSTGPGSFSGGGTCTLSGSGASASCSVGYSQAANGEPSISASYTGDTLHAPSTAAAITLMVYQKLTGNSTCTGVDGGTPHSVTVPTGATCTLVAGTVVAGNVTDNGTLTVIGTTIDGNLQATNSGPLTVTGSSHIGGNLQVQDMTAGTTASMICGTTMAGNLQWQYNAAPAVIGGPGCAGNAVGGNLQVQNNTMPSGYTGPAALIENNTVQGNLQSQHNTPAAVVSGNTVHGKTTVGP